MALYNGCDTVMCEIESYIQGTYCSSEKLYKRITKNMKYFSRGCKKELSRVVEAKRKTHFS